MKYYFNFNTKITAMDNTGLCSRTFLIVQDKSYTFKILNCLILNELHGFLSPKDSIQSRPRDKDASIKNFIT